MRRVQITLLALGAVAIFATHAQAGTASPKLSMHVQQHTRKVVYICTQSSPLNISCRDHSNRGFLNVPYDVYLIAVSGDESTGVASASFGITYTPGIPSPLLYWQACTASETRTAGWPAPGSGNRLSWNPTTDCQRTLIPGQEALGSHAVLGSFYVYAYDRTEIRFTNQASLTPSEPHVTDCSGKLTTLSNGVHGPYLLGSVYLSEQASYEGVNVCGGVGVFPPPPPPGPGVPVQPATWGRIKSSY